MYDEITGETATADPVKNCLAFAELVQCLDDRNLSLIIKDAKDVGRISFVILREFNLGKGKPRIIYPYTELMFNEEGVVDYMIIGRKQLLHH